MVESLPEGLVTTCEAVKGNIESVHRIDVEDIARLWKGNILNALRSASAQVNVLT